MGAHQLKPKQLKAPERVIKLVIPVGDSLKSVYVPRPAAVTYKPGVWVRTPAIMADKGLYLTAFPLGDFDRISLNLKQDWPDDTQIWSADAVVVRSQSDIPRPASLRLEIGEMDSVVVGVEYYGLKKVTSARQAILKVFASAYKNNYRALQIWPHGTLFCSRIKLIERMT